MRQGFVSGWLGAGLGSLLVLLVGVAVFSGVTLGDAAPVYAQDDELAEPAAAAGEGTAAAPVQESVLRYYMRALGWFFAAVFLILSFCLVALIVMNLLASRRENIVPAALIESFDAHLNEKRYQEAYDLAKNDESFLGHVLAAGLAKLSAGYEPALEAMQEVGEEEQMKLEHRLSYIALIGTVSPMIGLLGTVHGMVASFQVISRSNTTPKPSELAAGIATALVTTLVGLWLAIPAIAIFSFFRNRLQRLLLEVGVVSEQLMSRFQAVGQKK
jgi:biopolymer transport protein ExbB